MEAITKSHLKLNLMTEIVFATNNQNKINEIEILLKPAYHIKKII
jgi:hypothetical protein